jgi:hypothetical protein
MCFPWLDEDEDDDDDADAIGDGADDVYDSPLQ